MGARLLDQQPNEHAWNSGSVEKVMEKTGKLA
jgi:hypothetical protein